MRLCVWQVKQILRYPHILFTKCIRCLLACIVLNVFAKWLTDKMSFRRAVDKIQFVYCTKLKHFRNFWRAVAIVVK